MSTTYSTTRTATTEEEARRKLLNASGVPASASNASSSRDSGNSTSHSTDGSVNSVGTSDKRASLPLRPPDPAQTPSIEEEEEGEDLSSISSGGGDDGSTPTDFQLLLSDSDGGGSGSGVSAAAVREALNRSGGRVNTWRTLPTTHEEVEDEAAAESEAGPGVSDDFSAPLRKHTSMEVRKVLRLSPAIDVAS